MSRIKDFLLAHWILTGIIAILLMGGLWFFFGRARTPYQLVTVTRDSITESVSLTGNTKAEQSVSLAFGSSGIISKTYVGLGDKVYAGQVVTELTMNDLVAALHQAQAGLDQQQAVLEGLQSGARSEDIALYKQKYADASSALVIAMGNASLQAESAILRYADTLFTNGNSANPTITIRTQSQTEDFSINEERIVAGEKLATWRNALSLLGSTATATIALSRAHAVSTDALASITTFLTHLNTITGNLSVGNSSMTQADIDTDRVAVNTAAQLVNSGASAEQTAYAAWTSASQTLVSQESPAKPDDIKAQQAAVEAAQANVENAAAKIRNAQLVAPIGGTITQFDAKIGQLASPSTPLVSIMSDTGYEVDAGVSETDVGKISVSDKVSMVLDAFPNETFAGSVFYIAPAETNTQGVISYLIKISFDKPDPRLKSGLTVNVVIQTKHKDNVLILPQYAILQNDNGTFVETLVKGIATTSPVTLGIQDQNGNVEVLSGVTEGEHVITIGLKAP